MGVAVPKMKRYPGPDYLQNIPLLFAMAAAANLLESKKAEVVEVGGGGLCVEYIPSFTKTILQTSLPVKRSS